MNMYAAGILSSVIGASVIGMIIGLIKGYSKVRPWAVEYLLATFLAFAIGGLISANFKDNAGAAGLAVLGVAFGFLLAFASVFAVLKKCFAKHREKCKGGFLNVLNRILGGITLAVKGFVISGAVAAIILVVLDLSQFAVVKEALSEVYASSVWETVKPYLMDFMIVGVMLACIKCGYSAGLSSALWGLTVLALIVGAGFVSYHLAFNVETFSGAVAAIEKVIMDVTSGMGDMAANLPVSEIAKWILTAGLFLCMLVVVIILATFMPRLLDFARDSKIFFVIDGTFGSIFATVIVFGTLLFIGGVLQTINDLPFMEILNKYFVDSHIAKYFYLENIFAAFEAMPELPLRDWLTPPAA